MIPRQRFVNKLRSLGYSFKDRTKRVELYRKDGTTEIVAIPTHKLILEETARQILRQCGCNQPEIEAFISAAES